MIEVLLTDIWKNKQDVIYVITIKINFFHVIYAFFICPTCFNKIHFYESPKCPQCRKYMFKK